MTLFEKATPNTLGYRDVSPAQVSQIGNTVRLIDVREPHEYTGDLGHIANTELVPLATVPDASAKWDKHAEIVMICRSGNRSGRAAQHMAQMGFTKVMNMVGGMLAYNSENLPVVR